MCGDAATQVRERGVSMRGRERGVHARVGHVCAYCENVHGVCVCVCVSVCV